MSMTAVPVNVPGLEISITLLLIVASTWPSMTSTSQFEISTPLSLMLTPTNSLLPATSSGDGCGASSRADAFASGAEAGTGGGATAGAGAEGAGAAAAGAALAGAGVAAGVEDAGVARGVGVAPLMTFPGCEDVDEGLLGFAADLFDSLTSTQRSLRPRLSMA